ncbi:MAG: ribonuclease Z [Candidatus Altiarchaeia archaeon]
MDVTFLGTNGWYDSVTGNTISTLVETNGYYILLDAGNGIHKADQFMKGDKPVHMFLSHFHLDHLAGLHILAKFTHAMGLDIYGQPGTKQYLGGIMKHPYTIPFKELHYRAHVHELSEGVHEIPYRVECLPLIHADPCYGYRFEVDGKVLAYCTDTGYCENAVKLARGADLLITECSFKKGQSNPGWPHLNPEDAVRIAHESGAKKLALTHFDANNYRSLKERDLILEDHGDVFIAHDCMSLRV